MSREVSIELDRVVQRWRQLPLDHALSHAGRVRTFAQSLADGVAQATGVRPFAIPDRGPATLMNQLTVMVYDASAAGTPAGTSPLAQALATLRRELH